MCIIREELFKLILCGKNAKMKEDFSKFLFSSVLNAENFEDIFAYEVPIGFLFEENIAFNPKKAFFDLERVLKIIESSQSRKGVNTNKFFPVLLTLVGSFCKIENEKVFERFF